MALASAYESGVCSAIHESTLELETLEAFEFAPCTMVGKVEHPSVCPCKVSNAVSLLEILVYLCLSIYIRIGVAMFILLVIHLRMMFD